MPRLLLLRQNCRPRPDQRYGICKRHRMRYGGVESLLWRYCSTVLEQHEIGAIPPADVIWRVCANSIDLKPGRGLTSKSQQTNPCSRLQPSFEFRGLLKRLSARHCPSVLGVSSKNSSPTFDRSSTWVAGHRGIFAPPH